MNYGFNTGTHKHPALGNVEYKHFLIVYGIGTVFLQKSRVRIRNDYSVLAEQNRAVTGI
jgi:hypothetical protein